MSDGGGWNPMEHCDRSGVMRHVDDCPCPEHGADQALADLLTECERLRAALRVARVVVERYGRVWAKDTDYYAAAEALGIKEPPEAGE